MRCFFISIYNRPFIRCSSIPTAVWKKGDILLKRLKYYLLQMQNETTTYKEMYEGKMEVVFPSTAWDGYAFEPEFYHDPT